MSFVGEQTGFQTYCFRKMMNRFKNMNTWNFIARIIGIRFAKPSKILHLVFLISISYMMADAGIELSFKDQGPALWDASTGRPLCLPDQELMEYIHDSFSKYRPINRNYDYNDSLARTAHVMCRHLGFMYAQRVLPIKSNSDDAVAWGSSCLGYEPHLSHCVFQEIDLSTYKCKVLFGLECATCNKKLLSQVDEVYTITSPTFSNSYVEGVTCEWIIEGTQVLFIALEFTHLNLHPKDQLGLCQHNYLEILVEKGRFCSRHERFCGSQLPSIIYTNGTSITVRYVSGYESELGEPGFGIQIRTSIFLEGTSTSGTLGIGMDPAHLAGVILTPTFLVLICCLVILLSKSFLWKVRRRRSRRAQPLPTVNVELRGGMHRRTETVPVQPFSQVPPTRSSLQGGNTGQTNAPNIYESPFYDNASYLSLENRNIYDKQAVRKATSENTLACRRSFIRNSICQIPSIKILTSGKWSSLSQKCAHDSSGSDSVFENSSSLASCNRQKPERNLTYDVPMDDPSNIGHRTYLTPFQNEQSWPADSQSGKSTTRHKNRLSLPALPI